MTVLKNEKITVAPQRDVSEQKENLASEVMVKMTNVATIQGLPGRKKS